MSDLVSIIIPAYYAEKWISDALKSCISQTYENIEIVFVDDCSTDNTVEIARSVLRTDGREHQIVEKSENTGVSDSRNIGIERSKGKYLTFLDADDVLSKYAISFFVQKIVEINAKAVAANFQYEKENFTFLPPPNDCKMNRKPLSADVHVFGVLYRKKYLDGVRFHAIQYGEDLLFKLELLQNIGEIPYFEWCVYGYRNNDESVTSKAWHTDKMCEYHEAFAEEIFRIINNSETVNPYLLQQYTKEKHAIIAEGFLAGVSLNVMLKKKILYKKIPFKMIFQSKFEQIPYVNKLYLLFANTLPHIDVLLFSLYKIIKNFPKASAG